MGTAQKALLLSIVFAVFPVGLVEAHELSGLLDDNGQRPRLYLPLANAGPEHIPVVINELLASSVRHFADPQGEYDDWIELYNPGDAPIDAGGMYLTDDVSEPTKWRIPSGDPAQTTIPPRGYLLIWADKDVADPGLHAAFALDA